MRVVLLALVAGCSFTVGITGRDGAPGDDDGRDGPLHDGPTADASPCRAVEVSAMSAHTCARMENGDVWCWGINDRGQVGRPVQMQFCNGVSSCNPTPEKLAMPPSTRLGVAEEHACALAGADTYCWGRNAENQFGTGTPMDAAAPALILQRAGANRIGGGLTYGCSRHGMELRCSGANYAGEVGDNTGMARAMPVTTIPSNTEALALGYHHACAVESGFVFCWGANDNGQVTTTPGASVLGPVIVQNIGSAVAVAAGYSHSCAALALGDVRCWGDNGTGELGVDDTVPHFGGVVQAMISGIVDLSAGADHTCARTPAGSVFCWGGRFGKVPKEVVLPSPAVSIAAGSYHDCFALADGSVACLGWNAYGQLGLGTTDGQTTDTVSQVPLCP